MIIEVEFFGRLMPDLPRLQKIELNEYATVKDAIMRLDIDIDQVGLITVNGVQREDQDRLYDCSRLCFFTHMSGG